MVVEYKITGGDLDDITEDYIDRLLDKFYTMFKDKGFASLPDGIKLVEKKVYFIQTSEDIAEQIDREISKLKEEQKKYYNVDVDKTINPDINIKNKDINKHLFRDKGGK